MTNSEIDWSKAPEDAQYYYNHLWYKIEGGEVWIASDNGYWLSSADWSIDDNLDNNPKFIKRPVEAVSIKPPLGLIPKNVWEEQMQYQRRQDIHAAMQRYIEVGKEIPNEWLEELIGLNTTLAGIETDFAEAIQSLPVAKDGEWIEWGKNEVPDGLRGYVIEREYMDGEYRKGGVGEYTWNDGYSIINCDTVKRYRIIGEGEQE